MWIKKQKLYDSKNHNRRKTQIRLNGDSKVTPRWPKGDSKGTQRGLKGDSKGTQRGLKGDSETTFEKWPRDDIAKTLLSERFI